MIDPKKINISSLAKLELPIETFSLDKKLSRENAQSLLNINIETITKSLKEEINCWDTMYLLQTIYCISSLVAIFSSLIYERLVLKDNNHTSSSISDDYHLLIQTIQDLPEQDLLIVSSVIAQEKMHCDILFNLIYDIYLNENDFSEKTTNTAYDITELFTQVSVLATMQQYLDSISLLYEKNYSFYLDDLCIYASDDFQTHLMKFYEELINYSLPEDIEKNLQQMYLKCLGYTSNNVTELLSYITAEEAKRKLQGIQIEKYPINKFKEIISKVCNIKDYGVEPFIDSLVLKETSKDIDYKNKISIFPFVKLKDDCILFSVPLLLQSFPLLIKRMSQSSFTSNVRMQNYFRKKYNEYLLSNIETELTKCNIVSQKNVHLDKITNKTIKNAFVKGITKEFDLTFISNNSLYIVEYKNWATTAFSLRSMLNEYKKADNFVKEHLLAIEIVKNAPTDFQKMFNCDESILQNINLIMVFQNPNAFNYLNSNPNVIGYTLNDFIKKIQSNEY